MIDTTSHAGAWADAILHSPNMRVVTFDPWIAGLDARLANRRATRGSKQVGYSLAQGHK